MLPHESPDYIVKRSGPHSTKNLSEAMLFEDTTGNLLWRSIFEKDAWLERAWKYEADPVLVCPDLASITDCSRRWYNILFLTMDWKTGDTICDGSMRRTFFDCLRKDHQYHADEDTVSLRKCTFSTKEGRKIEFPRIRLNIRSVLVGAEFLTLPARTLRQCFQKDRLESQYCFANEKKVRTLENSKIRGIGGAISDPSAPMPMCCFWLRNKDEPQFIQAKGCPDFQVKGDYRDRVWELC